MGNLESGSVKLAAPKNPARVLLHCCCAPCAGDIIETLLVSQITPTVFFYNPNIDPEEEYRQRKNEVTVFAARKNVPIIDGDYEKDQWLKMVKGLEGEPEGGRRCERCFYFRLEKTAQYAVAHQFNIITTTLGISRYKNFDLITAIGHAVVKQYPDLVYWDHNWRKKGGSQRMYAVARKEGFYMQDYCGCSFSRSRAKT